MEDDELTPEQLAQRWEVTTKTLSQWRWRGSGPRFLKIGRKITYPFEDIKKFERTKLRFHTSEPASCVLNRLG